MSLYKQEFNPLSKSFNLVPTNTAIRVKDAVASQSNLPLSGNAIGDGRVTTDTGHLYIWSVDASAGLLTDWIDQGNFVDVDWAAITNKPSSSVANIDDAVSKRHTQNSDTKLADGTANEVTAANAKDAVDKKHTQGTDQGLDTGGANAVSAAQAKAGYTHSGVITGNPHQVNKSDVGLGNVDNKSEATIITDTKADTDVADAISKKHSHTNSDALALVSGTNTGDQVVPTTLADLSDDSTHRLVTDTEKSTWNSKQDAIGYTPENAANKCTSFQVTPDDTHYPSEKLVKDSLDAKQASLGFTPEDVSNKDTTTTLGTSDTKYPSQKAVKTYVDALGIGTNTLRDLSLNIMLNAFRIAQVGSLALLNMIGQFVDEYEDESGVDTVNSTNEFYDSTDDFYEPLTDNYTKLLLHLDNNVTDEVGKTVTNNNVTFTNTSGEFKFGYAAVFNGTNAYLTVPDSDDWNFGTDDFTIDFWAYPLAQGGNPRIYMQYTAGTYIELGFNGDTNVFFGVYDSSVTKADYWWSNAYSINSWQHFELIRSGTSVKLFVNGTEIEATVNTPISTNAVPDIGAIINIGAYYTGVDNLYKGNIDEFRVSKGIARHTSNFSVPTSPYLYTLKYNMTLLSNAQTAEAVPTSARLVLFEEDVDVITLNTDIKGYVSRDNGTTYSQVTLEDCGNYVSGAQILQGVVDISAQPSGTNMKYKVETLNNKDLKLHGAAISWR